MSDPEDGVPYRETSQAHAAAQMYAVMLVSIILACLCLIALLKPERQPDPPPEQPNEVQPSNENNG